MTPLLSWPEWLTQISFLWKQLGEKISNDDMINNAEVINVLLKARKQYEEINKDDKGDE